MKNLKTKLPKRLIGFSETAPEGFEYLAMVDTGWARSPDLLDAVGGACRNGRGSTPASGPLVLMLVAPGTRINGLGGTVCQQGDPEPIQIFCGGTCGNEEHWMRLSQSMIEHEIKEGKKVE